jgi:hypothetical protein
VAAGVFNTAGYDNGFVILKIIGKFVRADASAARHALACNRIRVWAKKRQRLFQCPSGAVFAAVYFAFALARNLSGKIFSLYRFARTYRNTCAAGLTRRLDDLHRESFIVGHKRSVRADPET